MRQAVITKAIFTNYRDKIIQVKETQIINIIKSYKILKNFSEYDEISNRIKRYCASKLGKQLNHTRNSS